MYCTCSMKTSYQTGIYCYFAFDLVEKLRSFLVVKHKASINAINMCKTYIVTRTLPLNVGLRCKNTTISASMQILALTIIPLSLWNQLYDDASCVVPHKLYKKRLPELVRQSLFVRTRVLTSSAEPWCRES